MGVGAYLRRWLMLRVIAIALKKRTSKTLIPLTGAESRTNDIYVVYLIDGEGKVDFVVDAMTSTGLNGKFINNGVGEPVQGTVLYADLPSYEIDVRHYYRGFEFQSRGIWSFLWQWAINYPYIATTRERRIQAKFNKQLLTRMDRIKVLEYLISETVKDRGFRTSPTRLLSAFYTNRWVNRPDKDELMTYYTLLLGALQESGDIEAFDNGSNYGLKSKALNTIAAYGMEERRHNENRSIQVAIVGLTVILLIVGAAQAVAAVWEAFFKAAS